MAGSSSDSPTDVSWVGALKRTGKEFKRDALTDWAAALTYYAVLALFPALLVLVSLVGLAGEDTTQTLVDNIGSIAPGEARDILSGAIEDLQASQASGFALVFGLLGALWSASGYIAAFMRASNVVWDVEEGRPIWKTLPLRFGVTLLMVVLLSASALAVVLTGPLAGHIGSALGIGETAVTVWDIAKWPVLVVIVSLMISLLYWVAPNVKQPGFQWVTPGGLIAVLLWIVASVGFAFYVANFGSYSKTYGSIASVIVFLVWLWILNIAILVGAELNAELERGRQMERGVPPEQEPFLPPRDEPKDT